MSVCMCVSMCVSVSVCMCEKNRERECVCVVYHQTTETNFTILPRMYHNVLHDDGILLLLRTQSYLLGSLFWVRFLSICDHFQSNHRGSHIPSS